MNPEITILDPVISNAPARNILARDGINCTLLAVAPGDETASTVVSTMAEQLLFVAEGQVTVRGGAVNTVVNRDEAFLVSPGRAYTLAASAGGWARVLRVDLPTRRVAPAITYPNNNGSEN